MFETTQKSKTTINFMYSKYRSGIPGENLASKWRCAVSVKYKSDFEELVQKILRDTVICILITC